MSTVNCLCGWQFNDASYPAACRATLVSQAAWERIEDIATRGLSLDGVEDMLDDCQAVWRCDRCGRMALVVSGRIRWYKPEVLDGT